MAYKRYARRRVRRRYNRRRGVAAKLKKLSKIVNRTKPTLKVEQTSYGSKISNLGLVATTGNVVSMFNPSNGTTFEERQNPVVHVDSIELGYRFTTSDAATAVRGLLFTSPDNGMNLSNMLFTGVSNAPYNPLQPSSLCDKRYKVLYDTGPIMIGTSGGLHPAYVAKRKINLKGMKVGFGNSTGSTVPDYHPIYWTAISEDNDSLSSASSQLITTQVCFRC